ncbi:hypothetical protein JZ751_005755 [Albula glossodonta]|uniref:Uncharacterized protein n=1 Tax=Albula glossodonta TaxID=121402 RepID=A0A8T2N3R7_9TELE|nr:hypothetical protein JZ751_005755 [Albula glossodonta]
MLEVASMSVGHMVLQFLLDVRQEVPVPGKDGTAVDLLLEDVPGGGEGGVIGAAPVCLRWNVGVQDLQESGHAGGQVGHLRLCSLETGQQRTPWGLQVPLLLRHRGNVLLELAQSGVDIPQAFQRSPPGDLRSRNVIHRQLAEEIGEVPLAGYLEEQSAPVLHPSAVRGCPKLSTITTDSSAAGRALTCHKPK